MEEEKEDLEAWGARIVERHTAFAAAYEAYRPVAARLNLAESAYRGAILGTRTAMQAVRRDLMNMGLSEPQIRKIIPDAGAPGKAAVPEEKPTPPTSSAAT